MGMMDVIKSKPSLDAEPVVIGRAVAAFGVDDLLVLDLISDLTADAAERAQRVDLPIRIGDPGLVLIEHHRGHQRTGRTSLHAFATGHTGRFPHRVVEIKHDLGVMIAIGHADHIIDLHFAAGAHAQATLDAGIEIDAHRRMAGVPLPAFCGRETAFGDLYLFGPVPEFRIRVVGCLTCGLVGDQKLHHHLLRGDRTRAFRLHLHTDAWRALAGRREHALAFDLDHAGAAIAVGSIVRRGRITQMRNFAALAFRHLPDGFADTRLDLLTVELELNDLRSAAFASDRPNWFSMRNRYSAIRHVLAPGRAFGVMTVTLRRWAGIVGAHAETSFGISGKLCAAMQLSDRELLWKVFNHSRQWIRGGLAEPADRGIAHSLAQFVEQFAVPHRPFHQQRRLLGAYAAGRALAAAFILEEPHQVQRGTLYTVMFG